MYFCEKGKDTYLLSNFILQIFDAKGIRKSGRQVSIYTAFRLYMSSVELRLRIEININQ